MVKTKISEVFFFNFESRVVCDRSSDIRFKIQRAYPQMRTWAWSELRPKIHGYTECKGTCDVEQAVSCI